MANQFQGNLISPEWPHLIHYYRHSFIQSPLPSSIHQGQFFSGANHRIYLLGNPVIWWSNLVFLALFVLLYCVDAIKGQRAKAKLGEDLEKDSNSSEGAYQQVGIDLLEGFIDWLVSLNSGPCWGCVSTDCCPLMFVISQGKQRRLMKTNRLVRVRGYLWAGCCITCRSGPWDECCTSTTTSQHSSSVRCCQVMWILLFITNWMAFLLYGRT